MNDEAPHPPVARVTPALRRLRGLLVPLSASLLLSSCSLAGQQPPVAQGPAHHTAGGYRNLHVEAPERNFFDFLAMRWFGDTKWADHAARAAEVPVRDLDIEQVRTPAQVSRITWLGHSTFLLQGRSPRGQPVNILTDPAFGDRVSPLSFAGPKRYTRHVVDYAALPPIDVVVISHNHYDHLDAVAIRLLGDRPLYLVPLGLKPWFVEHGVAPERVRELDWWDRATAAGLTFEAMPSQHWSARGLTDRFATLWASWLIHLEGRRIWFAGDTGYNPVQFREIGRAAPGIDIALIPIGGYAPRSFMRLYHVDPEGAIRIHRDVRARQSIGMHWGTYPLTAEGPIDPVVELEKQKRKLGLRDDEFITMTLGESIGH